MQQFIRERAGSSEPSRTQRTVEEIRTVAEEAENLLGGVYSLLAETLQAPLAYLTMYEASRGNGGMLLGIAQGVYRPSIITGIPALTRNIETANILRATQEASAIIPALVQLSKRFDPEKLVERIFANNSVDLSTLSKDPDVVAAEAEQEAALAQQQLDVASGALAAETSAGVLTS